MALSDRQEAFLGTIFPSDHQLFIDAYSGAATPRQCIRAFCIHCKTSKRSAIRDCEESACALYVMRPYQTAAQHAANHPTTTSTESHTS
jgi:hypothetical protein